MEEYLALLFLFYLGVMPERPSGFLQAPSVQLPSTDPLRNLTPPNAIFLHFSNTITYSEANIAGAPESLVMMDQVTAGTTLRVACLHHFLPLASSVDVSRPL